MEEPVGEGLGEEGGDLNLLVGGEVGGLDAVVESARGAWEKSCVSLLPDECIVLEYSIILCLRHDRPCGLGAGSQTIGSKIISTALGFVVVENDAVLRLGPPMSNSHALCPVFATLCSQTLAPVILR